MSDLPPGWEWTTIGELFAPMPDGKTIHQGWSPKCEKHPSVGESLWGVLKTTAIQPGVFYPEQNKELPPSLQARPAIEVTGGDLLITCAGPRARCGVACLVKTTRRKLMISGKMYRFRVNEDFVSPRYLESYLQTSRAWSAIDAMKTGGSDSGLNLTQGRFRQLPVPVAPRSEQERIVAAIEEHLALLDAAERALRSAQTRLVTFRKSTISEMLRGDWPIVRLGEWTVDQRYGSSARAGREGDVPVLRMGNIVDGQLDFADLKYLPEGHPDLKTCRLVAGDLLFNRTNSPELVGKSAVFDGRDAPTAFASYLIRVRLDEELDPHWVAAVINSPAGRRYIDTVRTQQVGQANVNGTKLKDFPIPMPSSAVQRKRLTQMDYSQAWFSAVNSEISRAHKRASKLRRSILAAGFSGQLVEQDPRDEPASFLLDRIQVERLATQAKRTGKGEAS